MIISDAYQVVFLHVPKCAGTSLRRQLERADPDARSFWGVEDHPEVGPLDLAHMSLPIMRDLYPETFQVVERYSSFAVVRDPFDRLRSSLSQHVKRFRGKRLTDHTPDELEPMLEHVAGVLRASRTILPVEYQHFTPQCHYVQIDKRELVTPYALEHLGALTTRLSDMFGRPLTAAATANQDLAFRNKKFDHALVWRVNDKLKASLPDVAYQKVKGLVEPMIVRQQTRGSRSDGDIGTKIEAMVHEFYAEDISLHARVLAAGRG